MKQRLAQLAALQRLSLLDLYRRRIAFDWKFVKAIRLCAVRNRLAREERDDQCAVEGTEHLAGLGLNKPLHLELRHQLRGRPAEPVARHEARRLDAPVLRPGDKRRYVRRTVHAAVRSSHIPFSLAATCHRVYYSKRALRKKERVGLWNRRAPAVLRTASSYFLAAFFAGAFFAGAFFAGAFFAAAFLQHAVLHAAFLAGAFFATAFLAGAFFAATFLVAMSLILFLSELSARPVGRNIRNFLI